MFSKKKEMDVDKKWFAVAIMTEEEMDQDELEVIQEIIAERVTNLAMSCNFIRNSADQLSIEQIDKQIGQTAYLKPMIVITEVNQDELDREIKTVKKRNRWRSFFGLIKTVKYLEAQDKALLNFEKIVFFSEDVEEAIGFLQEEEKRG